MRNHTFFLKIFYFSWQLWQQKIFLSLIENFSLTHYQNVMSYIHELFWVLIHRITYKSFRWFLIAAFNQIPGLFQTLNNNLQHSKFPYSCGEPGLIIEHVFPCENPLVCMQSHWSISCDAVAHSEWMNWPCYSLCRVLQGIPIKCCLKR